MERIASSDEIVVQYMGDAQRKAMFAKLRALGEGASESSRGVYKSVGSTIGSTIGNIRTLPTAQHHAEQAAMHRTAAAAAHETGNHHQAKIHSQLAARHDLLARRLQEVRSPEFHRTHATISSKAADVATMMGEHTIARKAVAESRAHEKVAALKEEGMKEATISADKLRAVAQQHRIESNRFSVSPGLKEKHRNAADQLEAAAAARDAARSEVPSDVRSAAFHDAKAADFARASQIYERAQSAFRSSGETEKSAKYEREAAAARAAANAHQKSADYARSFEGNTASEHRNAAMTHYEAGRTASLQGDHMTAQKHYAQGDFHMVLAREKDARTLGKPHLLGLATDTANGHLKTIVAIGRDKFRHKIGR